MTFSVSHRHAGLVAAMALMVGFAVTAHAATPGTRLRSSLAGIDATIVPSGRLHDRAVSLAGLQRFDGHREAPLATPAIWRQALHEMALASLTETGWPAIAEFRNRAADLDAAELTAIAVLDLAYETLRPDIVASGAMQLDNGRLVPVREATSDQLFRRHRAVLAAALDPAIHEGHATRFIVPSDLLITDQSVTIEADFQDGDGLRPIQLDTPVTVQYSTTGARTVRLRLIGPEGTSHWARFEVDVVTLDTPEPTAVWPLTASISFDGLAATGEAFIFLAADHTELVDPVVVVEGFDLDDSMNWPELYALLNQENLLEDLRASGRDAVVLNFDSATEPIQRNAFLLVELLEAVENAVPAGTTYPVIGASMGGLVSRFALAWLETSGFGHACSLFISFDVPHIGANIPLGLQCWLDFFASESDEASFLLSRLDTPAARQMLLYHHRALNGTTAAPDPQAAIFAAQLAGFGDWPTNPRLVSIANGSGAGLSQGFLPNAQLIDWEYGSLLVDIVGNVYGVPDGNSGVVFHGLIDLIWPLPDTERTVTVSGTLPWDAAPGGFRASLAQVDESSAPYGDIIALHDNHAFIPSVSTLAMSGAEPFADLGAISDFPPFDAVYLPAENQEHVAVTAENREWFLDEILGDVTAIAPGNGQIASSRALLLRGASPNPFNPRTEIAFALPESGPAQLRIIDARGRRVRTLVDANLEAGEHSATWDGRDQSGRSVAAGVYLAVIEQGASRVAGRLTLVP